MTEFFRSRLQVYFIENKQEADRIADQVLVNKRSRESAEKARLNIKKKLSGNLDISNRVQKFVDCRSRDVSRRELYIVEGDSALGSVKLSRDAEFQGIMPIRGKILNCLKADYDRIFKSEIITDLVRVLGCGVEVQNRHAKDLTAFDLAVAALEQGHHLHRRRRGRLSDSDAGSDHALSAHPGADSAGLCLHCRVSPVRNQLQGKDLFCL